MASTARHEIFVSYSHHDDGWRSSLVSTYVTTTAGDCLVWSDSWLRAGDAWAAEIDQRLTSCGVALLLASPHFLASKFVRTRELPLLLQRAREGDLRIVWVPIALSRERARLELPELSALQAATPFDDDEEHALPLDVSACGADRQESARQRVALAIQRAVDPVGAELNRLLAPRYAVLARVNEGNRAFVYRARDRSLERDVAVKVLKDPQPAQREAFMADVRRAIRLSEEPNFINLYDCAPPDSLAYCVQQLVQGQTLRQRLDTLPADRPLPVALLRNIFQRLAGALHRAHSMGITYGNLKPGNIILDENNEPFILPIGRPRHAPADLLRTAQLLERATDAKAKGQALTSADADDMAYLVPEQFGDAVEAIDAERIDQYMLGLIGWEMATRQRPTQVSDPQLLITHGRSAFSELPPVRSIQPLVPGRIEALLERMTHRRPRERFDDLQAVTEALDTMPDVGSLIVMDSWHRVSAISGVDTSLFANFYRSFLQRVPAAAQHFSHLLPEDWTRQYSLLKEAVLLLLAFHQQGDHTAEPTVLSRIAASHRHIPSAMYRPFADALILAVCGDPITGQAPADPLCNTPRHRDALEEHWRHALAPGIAWLAQRSGR